MRLLHTMLRVGDLDRSIAFYTELLGMKVLRRHDYPEGRFTLAFVGYADESEGTVLELTHNWDTKVYELGNAFGHLAIEVDACLCGMRKNQGARRHRRARGRPDETWNDRDRVHRRSGRIQDRIHPEKALMRDCP